MSKNSEHVKNWRKRTKERMVAAMGGSCACCGYNACNEALEFHHIHPSEKDFSFGNKMRSNNTSWSNIVSELKKCVLLCSNCHKEIHAKIRELPNILPVFDEKFTEYKSSKPENPCEICGKLKPAMNKFCSHSCASRSKRRLDWDKIDLERLLSVKSRLQIAEMLGVSWHCVNKRAKKLGLL